MLSRSKANQYRRKSGLFGAGSGKKSPILFLKNFRRLEKRASTRPRRRDPRLSIRGLLHQRRRSGHSHEGYMVMNSVSRSGTARESEPARSHTGGDGRVGGASGAETALSVERKPAKRHKLKQKRTEISKLQGLLVGY